MRIIVIPLDKLKEEAALAFEEGKRAWLEEDYRHDYIYSGNAEHVASKLKKETNNAREMARRGAFMRVLNLIRAERGGKGVDAEQEADSNIAFRLSSALVRADKKASRGEQK
jgi:hypothetical protein